jgi:putative acetyltransferase
VILVAPPATVPRMAEDTSSVVVRPYRRPDDAAGTHAAYRLAITRTAAGDYEPEQIAAWAGAADVDLTRWDSRRAAAHTLVAEVDGRVAGFVDVLDDGLLDMLFVHPDFGRRGLARLLVDTVKREAARAGLSVLRTHASRTARPAFERFGFWVVAPRPHNVVNGHVVPNYEMRCGLEPGTPGPAAGPGEPAP